MDIESFIKESGERDFHFLANRGNAGDGLIHAGFYRLAERLGLNLIPIQYPSPHKGKYLLIVGAGAFCLTASHNVEAVHYYSSRFEKVCILPSSFDTEIVYVAEMLRNLPENVTVFCRERISFNAVTKLVSKPERILLDHDLVFQIDPTKWTNPGTGSLNVFRTDSESLLHRVPFRNFDISLMAGETNYSLILDIVANFESIFTDRLHVAISGALLGKKVRLFVGNYHKILGIYEYSLKDRFPNVVLCNTEELKRFLAESRGTAFKYHVYHTIVRLPFGLAFINFVRKHLRKQVPLETAVS